MNILYFALITVFFAFPTASAQQIVGDKYSECVDPDKIPSEKFSAYNKFKYVDNHFSNPTFLRANLIFSDIDKDFSDSSTQQTGVVFSIKPGGLVGIVSENFYPSFVARCKQVDHPLSLTCRRFKVNDTKLEFGVNDFYLNLTSQPDEGCATGTRLHVSFSIQLNDAQYATLKKELISRRIPEDETDPKKFLTAYWKAFFKAWKDDSAWLRK